MARASRLDEDLAVIELLLTLHDSVRTAKVVQLSQSAISRRFRSCEENLGLRIRRTNGSYKLANCEQLFDQLVSTAADLRLQSGYLRWTYAPALYDLMDGVKGLGWWLETADLVEKTGDLSMLQVLLRKRIIDLYLCGEAALHSLMHTSHLGGSILQILNLHPSQQDTTSKPLHLVTGIPHLSDSLRQTWLMGFVNSLVGPMGAETGLIRPGLQWVPLNPADTPI